MNQTKKKYIIIGIIAVVFVVWLICISVILVKQFKQTEVKVEQQVASQEQTEVNPQELYASYLNDQLIPKYGRATLGDIPYDGFGSIGIVSGLMVDVNEDKTPELITLTSESLGMMELRTNLYNIENEMVVCAGEYPKEGELSEEASSMPSDPNNEFSGKAVEYFLKRNGEKLYMVEYLDYGGSGGSVFSKSLSISEITMNGVENVCTVTSGIDHGNLYSIINGVESGSCGIDTFTELLRPYGMEDKVYLTAHDMAFKEVAFFKGFTDEEDETKLAAGERELMGDYFCTLTDYTDFQTILDGTQQ